MKRVLRDRIRQRVLFTLRTGDSFSGVLWEFDGEAFVLRNGAQVNPEGSTPADGELVFLKDEVTIIQVLP